MASTKDPVGTSNLTIKKVKTKGIVLPSYLRSVQTRGSTSLSDTTPNITDSDIAVATRNLTTKADVIKFLGYSNPDVSQAINSLLRFAITDSYQLIAKTFDGQIEESATLYAQALAARFDHLPPDYSGFYTQVDTRSNSESLLRQLITYGAMSSELVLSQVRIPSFVRPVSVKDLKFEAKGSRVVPYLETSGGGTNSKLMLDSPLFFYTSLDQDLDEAYPISPLTSAVQPVLFSEEFKNDLRRAFRRAALPRIKAKINSEEFKNSLPSSVKYDEEALTNYMTALVEDLEDKLNDLNPEDVLVFFDILDIEHHSTGNISFHENIRELNSIINSNIAAGAKILPSILGRGDSQDVASTESMLYLRYVEGIQENLNSHYSKIYTLALRLVGFDVYCTFNYEDPELRPKSEVEAFKTMRQARILELLSYGFIGDTEASIKLTGKIPTGNFKPLSGTGFYNNTTDIENPYSNTSVTGKGVNETKGQKNTKSKAPTGSKRSGGQK